jgi:predicted secreted protein with PEFG-CTERM motif
MKIQTKTVFPIMAVFVTAMMLSVPQAFAETVTVSTPQGTSVPGCEATNECFIPYEVTVNVGDEVTWSNDDSAAHTVTAGSAADGPSGVFDSSLFMAGTTFSYQFESEGEFPYFCMVHPWMEGIVKVQAAGAVPMLAAPMDLDQIMAEIRTSDGIANEVMTIDLTLTDLDGNGVEHITYNIKATQGSDVVLDEEGHMHKGTLTNSHTTTSLPADASDSMPVEITIESVGFGHDELYVDAPGEIVTKQVVPEFGTIAAMILAVAIISIIAISAKSKLSIMPRL